MSYACCRHWAVSIHAPARGATSPLAYHSQDGGGFNPRSRTGSDPSSSRRSLSRSTFQSTLPHGERLSNRSRRSSRTGVSIHAPARGATRLTMPQTVTSTFQSTLPHGERRFAWWARPYSLLGFNPRSRTGSDWTGIFDADLGDGFNPRSRTGSNSRAYRTRARPCSFNPRSRTGSDNGLILIGSSTRRFNPRSRTGSDMEATGQGARQRCFNPRSRTGSDPSCVPR